MAGFDPDQAQAAAIESIMVGMLFDSNINRRIVTDRDLDLIKDLRTNPHYVQLLEEIMDQTIEDQKAYLAACAKIPLLRLVK